MGKLENPIGSKWHPATDALLVLFSNGANSSVSKAIRMSTKRLFLVLLLVIGCHQTGLSADKSAMEAKEVTKETKPDEQLEINKEALLKGPSEQMRIKAATVMLFSEPNALARKFLLDVLKQPENSAARMAVCKALIQTRAEQKSVKNKDHFIEPLLDILPTQVVAEAELAAEALLIFEYKQISGPLEEMATDPNSTLPVNTRLNAIYALKLQADNRAVIRLIELVDDSEPQVANVAEKALVSLGITVPQDPQDRKEKMNELKDKYKDPTVFLRERVIWQEGQMRKLRDEQEGQIRKLRDESGMWQERYLSALDEIYNNMKDDTVKGKFLAKHLDDSEVVVRLWALDKVYQDRVGGKPNPKLTDEVGSILVKLISDQNRDVRLRIAKVLALMVEVNSSEALLEQHKKEQSEEIKVEMFNALGRACQYAFSPNSGIEISPATRKGTLELATEYLYEKDPNKVQNVQKGADVIRRLLEQPGLASVEVDRYLGLLKDRYDPNNAVDGAVRGELLSAMAGLCEQRSACKDKARELFKPFFEKALEETNSVSEAVVDGIIYVFGKDKALAMLRDILKDDSSVIIRKKLIGLASEAGNVKDLDWLAKKIGSTAETGPAWQAMLEIFKRSDAGFLNEWMGKFESGTTNAKLADEQWVSFLDVAEVKAGRENKQPMLNNIWKKKAELFENKGNFKQVEDYLGKLLGVTQNDEEKWAIRPRLLNAHLRCQNVQAAKELVNNCLKEKDLDPNNAIMDLIDKYIKNSFDADPNAPNVFLKELIKIKTSSKQPRPKWDNQVKQWVSYLEQRQSEDPNKPEESGN